MRDIQRDPLESTSYGFDSKIWPEELSIPKDAAVAVVDVDKLKSSTKHNLMQGMHRSSDVLLCIGT